MLSLSQFQETVGLRLSHDLELFKTYGIVVVAISLILRLIYQKVPYDGLPSIGGRGHFSAYTTMIRSFKHGGEMLQEGYSRYKPMPFVIPDLNRWHVVLTNEKMIDELRKAPDDVLSFNEAAKDIIAGDYTLGPNVQANPYHISIVRSQLTRNLGTLYPALKEEIVLAVEDLIPLTDESVLDWTGIKAFDTMMNVVCRASNRAFVGVPKCRDPEFIDLNLRFTIDAVIAGKIINLFPDFLKPLAGRLFTNVPRAIDTGLKHLGPMIEERQRNIDEYGFDYPDKPNDMLSWLMDEARGEERSTRNIMRRIITLNFASIQTSSMAFTQALFDLACRPQYIPEIRDEVEAVVNKEGWSKVAIGKMYKLDSFFRESARVHSGGAVSILRKAMKDFTFSDGTYIPKGATVSALSSARQQDEEVYPNAAIFDPFRFCGLQSNESDSLTSSGVNFMTSTDLNYLPFGHGRHACPGRFFVSIEMKTILAHILMTYDILLEGGQPKNIWYGLSCVPDKNVEVLFRKRRN
ncbi:cytochrome P450 [Hysterangium stoloniferum]|nr:cytochrome P450 [Hysterangium stoloniferum]